MGKKRVFFFFFLVKEEISLIMSSLICINERNRGNIGDYGKFSVTLPEVTHFVNKSTLILKDDLYTCNRSRKRLTIH